MQFCLIAQLMGFFRYLWQLFFTKAVYTVLTIQMFSALDGNENKPRVCDKTSGRVSACIKQLSTPLLRSGYHHSLPSSPYTSSGASDGQRLPPNGTLSSEYLNQGVSSKVLLLICNTAGSGQQAVRWDTDRLNISLLLLLARFSLYRYLVPVLFTLLRVSTSSCE